MSKFIVIGERIHCISPVIREAMNNMQPEPIIKRAKEQIDAGAAYIDVNIGPAEKNGVELMKWAVKLLQDNFDNIPLALDTANMKAIEAVSYTHLDVYKRQRYCRQKLSAYGSGRMFCTFRPWTRNMPYSLCRKGRWLL